ncbi:hypothetical protein LCGC14_1266470 [marine sediment metagenome]|uniref:Uncharacterized protein n=1 Tax=marine sediment metagenome TaxID=412755 RepID=A0A0F9KZB7_9ZZZZ
MAQREIRLLWEYLADRYPDDVWSTNVELGTLPEQQVLLRGTAATAARIRPFRRRIDGTHWTADHYDLIEAKIRDPLPGLGALMVYEALAKNTPDLIGYTGQPFRKILVTPFALDWVKVVAAELGIEIHEFFRPWIADYFREIQNYFTRDYRIRRDEVKRLQKLLGVENVTAAGG